jgi:hypothetical protein
MKKIILILLIQYSCILLGQNGGIFNQPLYDSPIPPTPTSSVFRQFAGYTPSLATGTINVPIPLYDLKVNSFTLPFSIQYYTSGIKVMAPTFPLGYGWSFNPGLRITRTIRGRADGLTIFPTNIKSESQLQMMGEDERFYYLRSLLKKTTNMDNLSYLTNVDSQHDIFTIHLPSGNYSFIIKNETAYTFGNMLKIDIIKDSYCICGFEVTDEYGVKYSFGKESQSGISDYTEISTDSNYEYTAWMLRKIKLPDDNLSEINFTWVKNLASGGGGFSGATYDNSMPIFLKNYNVHEEAVISFEESMRWLELNINPNNRYGYSLQLKRVDFPLGSIKLEYYQDRALTSFSVQNTSNETIKQIDFTYENGSNTPSYTLLSSLRFSDEGKYKFTYNPERFIYFTGQDYWGYYNGKSQSLLTPKAKMDWGLDGQINFSGADRSIDPNKMQANMLMRVDYPTGGYTEFEYEPHRFEEPAPKYNTYYGQLTEGRGLRVAKVITKADAGATPVIKTYMYGKNTGNGYNTNGLGNVNTTMSTLDSFWELSGYETLIDLQDPFILPLKAYSVLSYRLMHINSMSHFDKVFSVIPPIYYNYVTEFISSGDNSTELKTEYTYANVKTIIDGFFPAGSGHYFVRSEGNLFSKGPDLISKKAYKTNSNNVFTPVENIFYQYAERFDNPIFGLYAIRNRNNALDNGPDFPSPTLFFDVQYFPLVQGSFGPIGGPCYSYIETQIHPLYNELIGETRTTYTDNGEITSNIEYSHMNNTLLLKKEISNSDGVQVTEEYQYRTYNNRTYAYPTITKKTSNELSENKQVQYYYNKIGQVDNIRLYKDASDHPTGLRVTYHNYNSYGKPVYLTLDDATKIVYLWSYKGQYPIAEIKNATYDQIKNVIPEATINAIADAVAPTTNQISLINNLRLQLPDAYVSTYTYKPLVGILSATDPSGFTTYYKYHNDGRLDESYIIKNGTKISLQRNDYNLVNSN